MKFNTSIEMEDFLNENSLPSTPDEMSKLSDEEREKYYKLIEDCWFSFDLNDLMLLSPFYALMNRYTYYAREYDEEFKARYNSIVVRALNHLQDSAIEMMDNGRLFTIDNYIDLVRILKGFDNEMRISPETLAELGFQDRSRLIERNSYRLTEKYRKFEINDYIKLLDEGFSLKEVAIIISNLPEEEEKIVGFFQKLFAKKIPNDVIGDSLKHLDAYNTSHRKICVLFNFINTSNPDVWYDYMYENNLLFKFMTYLINNKYYNYPCFQKTCDLINEKYDEDKIKQSFGDILNYYIDGWGQHTNIDINLLNFFYSMNMVSDEDYDKNFISTMKDDFSLFKLYKGKKVPSDIQKFMTSWYYPLTLELVQKAGDLFGNVGEKIYDMIFQKIVSRKAQFIDFYKGNSFSVYEKALRRGISIDKKILINFLLYGRDLTEKNIKLIFKTLHIKPFDCSALSAYRGDVLELINSFDVIDYFIQIAKIDRNNFIQYAFRSSREWLPKILYIFKNGKVDEFLKIKKFFFKNYYGITNDRFEILKIKSLLDIINNYCNYPELCEDITHSKLTNEDIANLRLLFDNRRVFNEKDQLSIKKKQDINNIQRIIFESYLSDIKLALDGDNIDEIKNLLCQILFNLKLDEVLNILNKYGSIRDMRQLLFDNRENTIIAKEISQLMPYISMMEDVLNCQNIDNLKDILSKVISDENVWKMCSQCNMIFRDYETKINNMYASEIAANLTKVKDLPETLIDDDLTQKYGVTIYDLSNSKYCFLEHIKSSGEEIETLLNGVSKGDQLFISLSAASHRNQRLYRNNVHQNIVFGCSKMPRDLFVMSSTTNMGSNNFYEIHGSDLSLKDFNDTERGILETSSSFNGLNSEILAFREGLKFDCIIINGSRDPNKEEIDIAKQYNMPLVRVQELNTTIKNPIPITKLNNSDSDRNHQISEDTSIKEISQIQSLLHQSDNKPRKIAIFTDSHGLFEPTLAILEDARKKGITEIYSLGDNIGAGPNPHEVLDLLETYNVKSLKGNHELYALGELEGLEAHTEIPRISKEVERNQKYAARHLTEKEFAKIKSFPENMTIDIGGQKVMLTHYIKDYNTNEQRSIPEDVSHVFQGHTHYQGEEGNVTTIRGAGIGGEGGKAQYVILTEKPSGGYDVNVETIDFNKEATRHDINESDMEKIDKEKINDWIDGKNK